jgi:hypothetical protein
MLTEPLPPNPAIDHHLPHRGPCGCCGGPDARHRLFDALWEFHQAGDSIEELADEYEYPVEAIAAVIELMRGMEQQS